MAQPQKRVTDVSKDTPRPRGRPPRVDNRRMLILDNAAQLFGRVGFEKGSIRDLADEMQLSKATIYHYFETKQEIYDAIFIRTLTGLVSTVTDAVAREEHPRRKLLRLMQAHAQFFEDRYWDFSTIMLGISGVKSDQLRDQAIEWRDRYEELIRKIFREGIRTGEIRNIDPVMGTRTILSVLNWMTRWWRPGGPERAVAIAEKYYDILLTGMSTEAFSAPRKEPQLTSKDRRPKKASR